jgi:hypothetical protein
LSVSFYNKHFPKNNKNFLAIPFLDDAKQEPTNGWKVTSSLPRFSLHMSTTDLNGQRWLARPGRFTNGMKALSQQHAL